MAWDLERLRKPRVAVAMLFREETLFRDMIKAAFGFQREPGWIFFFQTSIPLVDVARNVVASQAMASGAEYLFFWDSDVVVPPDIIPKLVAHGLPIVSALYWRRYPNIFPEVFRVDPKTKIPQPMSVEEIRQMSKVGAFIECDAVGLGCCLIHRSVLEKLAEKSNKFTMINPDNPDETLEVYEFMKMVVQDRATVSEDINFCSRVKHELGYKIFVDLSIECPHLCGAHVKDGKIDFPALTYGRER